MHRAPLRYAPYHQLGGEPNVIVDGSPTEGTVLTLSHWPGTPTPPGLEADLSIQMALRYLDRWDLHGSARLVSNNHFDQDGLTSAFVFVDPAAASERRELLADIGEAGDFATYRNRAAARVSMAIATYADAERTPLGSLPDDHREATATLYTELLGRLTEMCDDPESCRDLWAEEDATLDRSEALIRSGAVTIDEVPALGLSVVTAPAGSPDDGGHRFASMWSAGLHPMAVNNAVSGHTVLSVRGRGCEVVDRYETWVQYRSRRLRPRVDLRPLAEELNAVERSDGEWRADPPSALTPTLALHGSTESTLDPAEVRRRLEAHLAAAPPAWDPFPH